MSFLFGFEEDGLSLELEVDGSSRVVDVTIDVDPDVEADVPRKGVLVDVDVPFALLDVEAIRYHSNTSLIILSITVGSGIVENKMNKNKQT